MIRAIQCETAFAFLLIAAACSTVAARPYQFTNVIDSSWSLPQGSISDITRGTLSNGTAAFLISFNNRTKYSVFTGDGDSLTNLLNTGDPAPVGTFERLWWATISDGEVVIDASYQNGAGIFLSKEGSLSVIAKSGDPAPSGELTSFAFPVISHGNIAFFALYGQAPFLNTGIFKSDDGIVSLVGGGEEISAISGHNIAFTGYLNDEYGIIRSDGQSLVNIVQWGDPAPVGTFNSLLPFSPSSISDDNVAFFGEFGENGQLTHTGIFVGNGGPPRAIVLKGDPAPVGAFTGVWGPSIAGAYIAFHGNYGDASAIESSLFVANNGTLSTVITAGDPLFGSTLIQSQIGTLDDSGNGALGFHYQLADGRYGFAIATPVPEPERLGPSTMLIALLGLALNRRSSHQRHC